MLKEKIVPAYQNVVIDPSASIANDVQIGPWSVIGPGVEIQSGTIIGSHTIIHCNTRIGKNNNIGSFSSIGNDPQDLGYEHETTTWLEIGDSNDIREYVSISRGTVAGDGVTRIGNNNFLMSYTHVAHDCVLADHVILANNAQIAGHVRIDDYAILSAYSGIHQFCHIGAHSFLGRGGKIYKDILPFMLTAGNPAIPVGINKVGLKRRGFSRAVMRNVEDIFKLIYHDNLPLAEVIRIVRERAEQQDEIALILKMLENSSRGIARHHRNDE